MSSRAETVDYIEDQLGDLPIRTGKMFGEYGLWWGDKVVGFICDDCLFIKPSDADPQLFERTELAPPYPGAKNYHRVPADALDDREWLQTVVEATNAALPEPSPKKKRLPKADGGMKPHPRRPND